MIVLTEAASGAYVVTPVLASMAGAERVYALARGTRFGTLDSVVEQTTNLAKISGTSQRIEILTQKTQEVVAKADIITNSGHVRPIDREMVSWMKPSAVVPLMYEAWEFRDTDVDLDACRRRDIAVAGTNECHPSVDVFSYLGTMATKLLLDAAVAVHGSRILLLCDNPFARYLERGISNAGAEVDTASSLPMLRSKTSYDAIVVALTPRSDCVLSAADAARIMDYWPGAVVAQFMGDIDQPAFSAAQVQVWPREAPPRGHMGILPSAVGPEPIVRLQAGGLKVGEILCRQRRAGRSCTQSLEALFKAGYGQAVETECNVVRSAG